MGDMRSWFRFRRTLSKAEQQAKDVVAASVAVMEEPASVVEKQAFKVTEGVHYLATHHGFLRRYEREYDQGQFVGHRPVFTNNPRLARPYGSFEEADRAGKQLSAPPRRWIKYYAIVKPA